MVKGKAAEVEVPVVVAVVVEGKKPWLAICLKENLIAAVMVVAAMPTVATVVIQALLVVMEG